VIIPPNTVLKEFEYKLKNCNDVTFLEVTEDVFNTQINRSK